MGLLDRLRSLAAAQRRHERTHDGDPPTMWRPRAAITGPRPGDGPVPEAWLKGAVTVDGIDKWLAERAQQSGRPVDEVSGAWPTLKGLMQPGDEIQFFSSDAESWGQLAGREGYALVRGGRVIDSWITMMN